MNIKKLIVGASAAAVIFSSLAVPAFAVGDYPSDSSADGYYSATSNTECAVHGSFGYFGKDWNLGNDISGHYPGGSWPGPGADGYQTGINNGTLCGNRQGNLP